MSKAFKKIGKLVSGVAGGLLGGILGGGEKTPKALPPPPVEQPKAIPLESSAEVAAAKRKARAAQAARGGRASTVLSDQDSLGG